MQLYRPPVLRRWENQRMLSSFHYYFRHWFVVAMFQPCLYVCLLAESLEKLLEIFMKFWE